MLLGLVGACYAPTLTIGAPCDPVLDNCPASQVCAMRAGEFRCGGPGDATSDAPFGGDAASDAALDAVTDSPIVDAPPDTPPLPTHVEYVAVVADCVDPVDPDPDTCKTVNGSAQIAIDSNDSTTGNPWVGYIRFDLDGVIAGRTVTSLKLRLVATSDAKAGASNTGQIWRVGSFTRQSLFSTIPSRIGAAPIALTQGTVDQLQVIHWTLPVSVAVANGGVFLELETTSSDGTNYWNLTGPNPPRLIIDMQ